MMPSAATSTRSEREIASLVFVGIDCNSFGKKVSLGQLGLVYFAPCVLLRPFGVTIAVATSNRLSRFPRVPRKKVPNSSQLRGAAVMPAPKTNRQINFFVLVTGRHRGAKNPGFSCIVRVRVTRRCDSFSMPPAPRQAAQRARGMVNRKR